jgi:hypothetical protein
VDRLLRPGRLGRQVQLLESAGLRIPDEPLHRLAAGSGSRDRIGHRLGEQVVRGGKTIDREHMIELAGEQRDRGAGARRHRVAAGLTRQPSPLLQLLEQTDRGGACRGGRVGHERRGQQILLEVGVVVAPDSGSQRLDDAGPVLHVVGSQPRQQGLPGFGAQHADEFPGERAGPRAGFVVALQQIDEHGKRIDARPRQPFRRRGPRGSGVAGQIVGLPLEPGGIAPPLPCRLADGLHDRPHGLVVFAEHAFEPPQTGWISRIAKIGEQIETGVAGLLQQLGQPGKISAGNIIGIDVGRADRGIEQSRRRRPRGKGK